MSIKLSTQVGNLLCSLVDLCDAMLCQMKIQFSLSCAPKYWVLKERKYMGTREIGKCLIDTIMYSLSIHIDTGSRPIGQYWYLPKVQQVQNLTHVCSVIMYPNGAEGCMDMVAFMYSSFDMSTIRLDSLELWGVYLHSKTMEKNNQFKIIWLNNFEKQRYLNSPQF